MQHVDVARLRVLDDLVVVLVLHLPQQRVVGAYDIGELVARLALVREVVLAVIRGALAVHEVFLSYGAGAGDEGYEEGGAAGHDCALLLQVFCGCC